jgi:hypothetical protein
MRTRVVVTAVLATAAMVMAGSALAPTSRPAQDPMRRTGSRTPTSRVAAKPDEDRSVKLDLISRLRTAPELVVLGSSRARRAEPSFLRTLTGLAAFNAAVTGGTAADAWVMIRYLADCRPLRSRRYLWFVDAGVANEWINPGLEADPRSQRYLGPAHSSGAVAPRGRDSCRPRSSPSARHNPDGSYTTSVARSLREHSATLDADVARLVSGISCGTRSGGATDPRRYIWFEKALAFMNRRGSRPVIVFNPIQPKVLARLRECGFPARQTSAGYLARLHRRFDFVVVDGEDIRHWGGSPDDFWDPTHINYANTRRLLAYVVAHSAGAFR